MNSSTETPAATTPPMGETQPLRKFMFDRTFVAAIDPSMKEEEAKPTFTFEQMESTRQQAYESGYAAGQKSMEEDQRQKTMVLLTQITEKLDASLKIGANQWQNQLAHLQEMAVAITRKIIPDYASRHGLDEIQGIISQTITEMAHEPRLVVRVSESQFDAASARIKEITDKQAYEGKVVILGEPDMGPSDCRIEWADGGIERDLKVLWEAIERITLAKQNTAPEPITEPPSIIPTPAQTPNDSGEQS